MSTEGSTLAPASPINSVARDDAQTTSAMPIVSPKLCAAAPKRSKVGRYAIVSNFDGAQPPSHASTPGFSTPLLTPSDILSRLSMTSADPAKWMRRTFVKHGVPYVHACGKMRATEAQYQILLEKITCSPSVPLGRTTFTIFEEQSRSATSSSMSKSSVQERVSQMLRRT